MEMLELFPPIDVQQLVLVDKTIPLKGGLTAVKYTQTSMSIDGKPPKVTTSGIKLDGGKIGGVYMFTVSGKVIGSAYIFTDYVEVNLPKPILKLTAIHKLLVKELKRISDKTAHFSYFDPNEFNISKLIDRLNETTSKISKLGLDELREYHNHLKLKSVVRKLHAFISKDVRPITTYKALIQMGEQDLAKVNIDNIHGLFLVDISAVNTLITLLMIERGEGLALIGYRCYNTQKYDGSSNHFTMVVDVLKVPEFMEYIQDVYCSDDLKISYIDNELMYEFFISNISDHLDKEVQ